MYTIHATYQHILYVNIEICNHNYIITLIVIYDHYFTITLVYGRIACSTYNSDSVNALLEPRGQLSGPP